MREHTIKINVNTANPGQFFACCGLLELADRLWNGAEGWFENGKFSIYAFGEKNSVSDLKPTLANLLSNIADAPIKQVDLGDDFSSPMELLGPFKILLNWWKDSQSGGSRLKVWAGSMRNTRIARAMKKALSNTRFQDEGLLDHHEVVYDPEEPRKKVEPFNFDARRGSNSKSIDVGFSLDTVKMSSSAYPAVEFLCLVGLQRFRPAPAKMHQMFDYCTWAVPLDSRVAPLAVFGVLPNVNSINFRFENAFRTDYLKSFLPANLIGGEQ